MQVVHSREPVDGLGAVSEETIEKCSDVLLGLMGWIVS